MQEPIDNSLAEVLDTCNNCGALTSNSAKVNTLSGKEFHACSEICYDDLAWREHDEYFGLPSSEEDTSENLGDL